MTVGKKLTLIGVLLVGLTILLGVVTLSGLRSFQNVTTLMAEDAVAGLSACSNLESKFLELRGDAWRHVAAIDANDKAIMEREIQKLQAEVATDLKDLQATIHADDEREINRKIDPALQAYYTLWEKAKVLSRADKDREAYETLAGGTALFIAARDAIRADSEYNRQLGVKYTAQAAQIGSRVKWLAGLVLLLSVVLGSGTLFFFVRSLTRILRHAVRELNEGAGQVSSAAAQVATSSQGLAQGASEQAASLEETSSSSEEITSMTRKNAENSSSAASLMGEVDQHVHAGNRTLEQMVQSMQEITGSSDKISKIIKVIDEIAFQTNILALNAAVEAARAGEAGMGFAVVADEVRSLAQRSAQAAKDTATLIEESIAKSHEGGERLQRVADVMQAITGSAGKVKELVDEVHLGSQEQARGIEQISKSIAQMEQVTQNTAANAEESASASEQLSAQAQAMHQSVRQIAALVGRVEDSGPHVTQPKNASRAPNSVGLRALNSAVAPAGTKADSQMTASDAEFVGSFEEH